MTDDFHSQVGILVTPNDICNAVTGVTLLIQPRPESAAVFGVTFQPAINLGRVLIVTKDSDSGRIDSEPVQSRLRGN